MVDIHSHILHGVEDSPDDINTSLEIARQYEERGFTHVVSTPHFNPGKDDLKAFVSDCEVKYTALTRLLADQDVNLILIPGAEVMLCPELAYIKDIDKLKISNTRYLLLEFPWTTFPANARNIIYSLELQGIIPILAHPERNRVASDELEWLLKLTETGLLLQIDAESVITPKYRKIIDMLFRRNAISFIATDIHRPGDCFINFERALEVVGKKYGSETMQRIIDNSMTLINNGQVSREDRS